MTWLQKIAVLSPDWWRHAGEHLKNVLNFELGSGGPMQLLSFGPSSDKIGQSPIRTGFGQDALFYEFRLAFNDHIYSVSVALVFDGFISNQIRHNKDRSINTDNITLPLFGTDLRIMRDLGSGEAKNVGEVDLSLKETTPYNIVKKIREMIESDRDDDPEEPEDIFDLDPNPGVGAPEPSLVLN